jgi:hypothetical protein
MAVHGFRRVIANSVGYAQVAFITALTALAQLKLSALVSRSRRGLILSLDQMLTLVRAPV